MARTTFFFACLIVPAASFVTVPAFAQSLARPDHPAPAPLDWSSKHVVFPAGFTPEQAERMRQEPRAYAQWLRHGLELRDSRLWPAPPVRPRRRRAKEKIGRDWAVSLGAGGVAPGMAAAKYTFDVNAAPSCSSDFVVFPINASTGNTRAHVVGTFTGRRPTAGRSTSITITPANGAPATLTLTASDGVNTGLDFQTGNAATDATDLAAAINRNLSNVALDGIVAVASGATVTVYALTAGSRVALSDVNAVNHFSWAAVTPGTNGTQANIVAFNQLYSGSGTPLCTGLSDPEFIFSYASGVGPTATSPNISLSGKEISYVENDPNIGAILHVLTFATGSTEYGAGCAGTNNGTVMPTCATDPVIPGSTANSTATDFMLPLGLVAANATTATPGANDSFSSPFIDYLNDTTFVGDDSGLLYSITPTFTGTPAYAGGNFPVQVSPAPLQDGAPSQVAVANTTGPGTVVAVTVNNTLGLGELVTISGVAADFFTGCNAADAAAINGTQMVLAAGLSRTQFEFDANIPTATTGCDATNATVTEGSSYLTGPVVDVSGTGNVFVGDSSANLYELTPTGTTAAASLSLGENLNGGIRDAPLIDSTNEVGYVVTACTAGTSGGESQTLNSALIQFKFTSSTLSEEGGGPSGAAGLDSGANQACSAAGFPIYDPTPDERYFQLGISNPTAANNGEIITGSSGTGGQQLKAFQFANSGLLTTPEGNDKPQIPNGPSTLSPLTEFFNSQNFTVAGAAANATTVTITAANTLAANDMVTISGVTANAAGGCTAADAAAINGGLQTVASASATQFTFSASLPSIPITGLAVCTATGAIANGGPDYLFLGVEQNSELRPNLNPNPDGSALYSLLLPSGVLVPGAASANPPIVQAMNFADVAGGTSAIIVDNNSTAGQAASLYFGTLATSTTICGTTAAYCAIKVTQAALQ